MTISGALLNALSGLTVSSKAAELVSSNVANATTEGYGVRNLSVSSQVYGGTGYGVRTDGVVRNVDEGLIENRRLAGAGVGYGNTLSQFLSDLENILGTPDQPGSLTGRLATLESALITAGSRPDSEARLSNLLSAAQGLAQHLQTTSDAIQTARMDADREISLQVTIGAVVRFLVLALQIAGSIAAQSTSLSQIFGGATVDPQPAMGHVLLIGGLALAVYSGLHIRLAGLFLLSYEVFPPGQLPDAGTLTEWGIRRAASAFNLAFALAAPFVIASLIYNVALGVINRAMPQLMVAFVGAPAITAGGLILLAITAPFLLSVWLTALNTFLDTPFRGY